MLAQNFFADVLALGDSALAFDLALHVATLLPVVYLYRRELFDMAGGILGRDPVDPERSGLSSAADSRKLVLLVGVATVPTGLMGVLGKDLLAELFHSPRAVGVALLITGTFLFGTRRLTDASGGKSIREFGVGLALLLGLVQGLAITPGISRSGATIAAALFLGVERELAARFSFLMALPAICGAAVLEARHGVGLQGIGVAPLAAGMLVATLSGYGALVFLVKLVKKGNLSWFAFYLWPAGLLAFLLGG